MKRRDYLLLSSLGGVTGYKLYNESINTAYASINQFNIVGDDSLDQSKTNKLQFNLNRLEIETRRLDDDKNATLTFEAKYQDESEYTTLESKEIDINSNDESNYANKVEPIRLFGEDRLQDDKLQENDFDNFQMKIRINHPDIQEISQTSTFQLGLVDLSGELEDHNFEKLSEKDNEYKQISNEIEEMKIWGDDRLEILIHLLDGVGFENKSSYTLKGGIDNSKNNFEISPRNTGEKTLQKIESNENNFKGGSEMKIWGDDRLEILIHLLDGVGFENKSSYTLKGGIDNSKNNFEISPRNTGEKTLQKIESNEIY